MPKLRARKLNHNKKPSSKHRGGTRKPRKCWLTNVQWWSCGKKERSKLHPNLTIKAQMEKKTEVFKRVAIEAKVEKLRWHSQQRHNTHSLPAILQTDRGLCYKHHHPWPHRCQQSSSEDKRGKGLHTTPTLHPAERWDQSGWKESNLENALQNPDKSPLKWRPDQRAGVPE